METFSFNPPINLVEDNWVLAVTSFEATNSVFNITNENNSFSISIPFHWRIPIYLEDNIIVKLQNFLKPKSENDIELHVIEVRKRGNTLKKNSKDFSLTGFDS